MGSSKASRRIDKLRAEIERHEYLYHVRDRPEISDQAYDLLFRELQELEAAHPKLIRPDSPTQRVGGAPLDAFTSVEHMAPMLSLDSHPDLAEVERFDERVRKGLGEDAEVAYVCEPKLDGASVELVYEDGVLARAATRGDGQRGEDVTDNVRTIAAVPLRLRDEDRPVPPLLALRGEIIIHVEDFEALNERLIAEGREPFANPRNAAAGALRQLDSRITASRPLDVYLFDVLAGDPGLETQWRTLRALREWGLRVNDLPQRVETIDEIADYHRRLIEGRDDIGYEIDGVVIKLDDLAARVELGATSHHPRWAFAFKFPPRKEITRVLGILASVGRTGVVTPVAMLRPVELGGVTVSRASLHNREEVARKDIREGDLVRVQRAGDVIPQVVERIEEDRKRKPRFKLPRRCPSCDTELIERGPFTVCPNSFECPAQLAGRLIQFGSRRALDIEGLGEETARLLIEEGLVRHLPDLFALRSEQLVELEGFAEKSATALVEAIEHSSTVDLDRFLFALGIPEVGVTVGRDLARHFGKFAALREASTETLAEVHGVGPKMATAIREFLDEPHNAAVLDQLVDGRVTLRETEPAPTAEPGPLDGKKVVFTGGLESLSRDQAKALVEEAGGRVTGSVSKATDYVVVGENPGSKAKKAGDLGVELLDEASFRELIGLDS